MSPDSVPHLLSDPAAVRREFPLLAREGLHYLDSAATAQMPQAVIDALHRFGTSLRANVYGGVYRLAREALAEYEAARADIARFTGASSPKEVVFTYGTTSALNLLAHSFGERLREGDEIVLSSLEHHSNTLPWRALAQRRDLKIRVLPVTADGRIDLRRLSNLVPKRCRLIAVTHCSNVTGAITDVAAVVAAARSVGAAVALDGAQRAPHGPIDVQGLGIDFYAFSGHKTSGQRGLASCGVDWAAVSERERALTARLLQAMAGLNRVRIIGPPTTEARRGVVSFTVSGLSSEEVCRRCDRYGLALRHGHHCAQPLMIALGIEGTARASLAPYTTDEDIDQLVTALAEIAR